METLLLGFPSLECALDFADRVFETPLLPAAVEVINPEAAVRLNPLTDLSTKEGNYLVAVSLEAFEEAVSRMRTQMMDMAAGCRVMSTKSLAEEAHIRFWLGMATFEPSNGDRTISLQFSYPLSEWRTLIGSCVKLLSAEGIPHQFFVHAGNGICLMHLSPVSPDVKDAVPQLLRICRKHGGNLTVQKAPLEMKADLPVWGDPGMDEILIKRIKNSLDPSGIMSPGRFVGGL
jgi:glycolate oxidase FAD binding subunit